jgi:hypothetical protein
MAIALKNFSPSGPQFGLKYDGSFIMTRKSSQPVHQSPAHEEQDTAFFMHKDKPIDVTDLSVLIDDNNDTYTVQEKANGTICQILPSKLLDHDPTTTPTDANVPFNHLYDWIKHKCKATLYLSDQWSKPKQG